MILAICALVRVSAGAKVSALMPLMTPALTTVAEDHSAMAEALFDMVQRMSQGKTVSSAVIAPYLIERESIFPAG